ncbi:apolipoprotein A-IV-like [Emydura macquarii macquarii]|uniref:apolipoprotein A-IV-like n=1 Tax=Emydura macquarii macquarii TaxID=1129001 RepID=UPI003529E3AF
MKLLAGVLWLAVLIGSQASPLSKEPTPRLEQVKEAISNYAHEVIGTTMKLIQTSELGTEIEQWTLYRKIDNLFDELGEKLPPQVEEQLRKLSRYADGLLSGILGNLYVLERTVQSYKQELQAALESYSEGPLELLEQYGKQVSSLAPAREELQEKLGSYAQELGLQELQRGLAAHTRDLRQTLSPYAEDLHGWLISRWDSLMQWFQ